jgi:hypothetical protein
MSTISAAAITGLTTLTTSSNTVTFGSAMYLVANGNLGIGTASPTAPLTITGSSVASIFTNSGTGGSYQSVMSLRSTSPSYGAAIQFYDGTNDAYISWYNQGMYFAQGSNARMTIDSSGNVGIGTTSPGYKLDVSGTIHATGLSTFDNAISLNTATLNYLYYVSALSFAQSGTGERMRIDSAGNVTVGYISILNTYNNNGSIMSNMKYDGTNYTKTYAGAAFAGGWMIGAQGGGYGDIVFYNQNWGTTSTAIAGSGLAALEKMRIDTLGNVLIGTNTYNGASTGCLQTKTTTGGNQNWTAWNADTTGNRYFAYFAAGSTFTGVGSILYNGSTTVYNTTSDRRLKENIVDAGSSIGKLSQIKIRSFDWKNNRVHVDFGIIAQELHEVAPEAVTIGNDNEDGSIKTPWQVDTSTLVPMLIAAIQELKAELDQLKNNK